MQRIGGDVFSGFKTDFPNVRRKILKNLSNIIALAYDDFSG